MNQKDSWYGSETYHSFNPLSDKLCGGVNPRQLILLYIFENRYLYDLIVMNNKEVMCLKIISIRLINFSSIFACRNLKEVYYEFDKSDKTINQICGPNRSGKTVLIQQLHPFSSINLSGDERSDLQLIIPNEVGVKEVTYDIDGQLYHINHTYKPTGKSHSVVSSLMCNGKELNPSGGVNTFNTLIEKIFGLNRYTFQFTINGTQLNSLSNMNATQRKTLLNKALGVDIYDKIHKLSTSDHRYVSKTISSLNNTKEFILKKYGTYEVLQNTLSEKQQKYSDIVSNCEKIKSNMDKLVGSITIIDAQRPFEELNKMNDLLVKIKDVNERVGSYDDNTYSRLSNESIDLNKQLEQLKSQYQILIIEADNYEEKKDNLKQTMMKSKRLREDYNDLKNVANDLESKIINIKDNPMITLSPEYYYNKINIAQTINSIVTEIVSNLNDDLLKMIVDMVVENVDIPAFLIREGAVLNDSEKERTAMKRLQSLLSTVGGNYPEECHVDCVYKNTYERLQVYFNSYNNITKGKLTIDDLETIDHCWKSIVSIKRLINEEYPDELKNVFKLETIMMNMRSSKWGIDFDYIKSLYEDAVNNEQRRKLIEQLQSINDKLQTFESVIVDYTNPENAINDINMKLNDIDNKRNDLLNKISIIENDIRINENNRKLVSQLNGINVGEIHNKIDKLTETINTYNDLKSSYSKQETLYQEYMIEKNTLTIELESLQTDDIQCKRTMNELMMSRDSDRQYKLISDATSSTKGLPVVLIHNTLDESIKIANHLLDVIYDGSVKLDDVEVNETSLNIPFTHDFISSNDIRYGSQSESTIFSLVLSLALSTQLTNYNIILIDEIDAYLDHEFKNKFLLMLDEVSRLLSIDQVFLISHNIDTDQFSNIINKISLI